MGEKYGIYARISYVKRTTKDGKTVIETLGVDRQEPPCRELVERTGGEVYRVYVDNDISAYSGKRRPDYEAMLEDAETGVIDGIVAWHPDRLTRQPTENERLITLVETTGIKLATAQAGECDLSTPAGRLNFRLLGNIARYESEHKAARIMLKNEQMAAAGEPAPGPRAYGYEPGGLVIRESEAAIVREATRRLLAGEPMGAIVRELRDRKVTGAGGALFTTTSLRNVLCNPRLAGIRVLRGQEAGPGAWPPIIPEADYRRVRGIFSDRTRGGRGPRAESARTGHKYAFSGLLVCPECSGRLIGSSGAYRCPEPCRKSYINAEHFESAMLAAIEEQISTPEFAAWRSERLEELEAGDTTHEELERDRAELTDYQALPERFRSPETMEREAELKARVRAAEARLAARPEVAALQDIPTTRAAFLAAWKGWSVEQRRTKLGAMIESVVIKPATRRRYFDPSRIRPRWR